jgi:hypothetical protein
MHLRSQRKSRSEVRGQSCRALPIFRPVSSCQQRACKATRAAGQVCLRGGRFYYSGKIFTRVPPDIAPDSRGAELICPLPQRISIAIRAELRSRDELPLKV